MKKLLLIPLLFLSAFLFGQTAVEPGAVLQTTNQAYVKNQTDSVNSRIYQYFGAGKYAYRIPRWQDLLKYYLKPTGDVSQYIRGDGSLAVFPGPLLLKSDSVNNNGYVTHGFFNANASYLGDWNSTFALTGYYNKPGKIVSYNGVLYVIKTNPGTNPPTNTNGGAPYYEPYNPAGKRTIKIMSLAGGVNAYSILSLYEPTTLQAYLKMNIVVGENVSGNFIEAQSIDANLSNIDHLTPLAWYTVNPKTFKSNLDTTLLKNRTVAVQVRYNPGVSGFGTLEVRYKSNYGTTRYTNGIFVKASILSNRDLFPLDSTYTVAGTFPVIEPSSTEYLNQIYDANGVKYVKDGDAAIKHYADSLYDRTVNKFDNQTNIAGNKFWIGEHTYYTPAAIGSPPVVQLSGFGINVSSNTGRVIGLQNSGGSYLSYQSGLLTSGLFWPTMTGNRTINLPDKSGTVALVGDTTGIGSLINAKLDTTGKSLNTKRDFGVIGDAKVVTDAVVTASSVILTSATANFTTADIGKTIGIPYAGADNGVQTIGNSFITTIASINSTTSINLTSAPIKTIASGRTVTDAAMTAGSNVLTSATATFLPSDVGKKVFIPGAGSLYSTTAAVVGPTTIAPYILTAWIKSYTSATQVVLTKNAINTTSSATVIIPGAWVNYGTDNTTNLQAAVTAAQNQKTALYITAGRYLTTSAIQVGSDLTLQGQGMNKTIISPVGTNFAAFSAANLNLISATVSNIKFSDFEVDCFGVTTNTYIVSNKAFNINPARNIVYENLYVHDTGGSGIGTDFMRRVTVEACIVEHCGRQFFEFGANAGGSGLGFGQGVFTEEPSAIRGNFISNCGNAGILIEGQVNGVNSTGVTISGNYLEFNGVAGVGDFGTNGIIINGNNFDYNDVGIRGDKGAFQANTNYSKNSSYTNNIMRDNRIGILTFSLSQGHKISDNKIYNETVTGTTGIKCFSLDTSTVARDLIIENNQIYGVSGPGIDIATSVTGQTFGNLIIKNNELYNNGASTSVLSPAIDINAKVRSLYAKDNIAYDNRTAGNKTQSYGLRINAFTIGQFDYGGNNFLNNATAPDIFTGATITTQITQPTYERAGVFTGAQAFSANTTFGTNSIYDITNTRLGIGTLTPSFMLHIEGASALGLLKRNSATGTSAPKFIMTRTGSTLTTDISANFVLGGFQFRGRVAGVDSDYGQLGYVANTTTVGDGKFSFYKADLTTSVLDINNSNGSINIPVLTASQAVFTDAGKNLISIANTGTGNNVLATSPTLTTPALGTPTALVLTNATGLPTAGLVNNAVTYAKMQAMTTNKLLGSGSGTAVAEITLGTNLSFTGTTLNGTGGSGTVTSITPGYGHTSATPITTTGTVTIDTSSIRTVGNSYSLSGMQTKLNLYGKLVGGNSWTNTQTFNSAIQAVSNINIQGGNALNFYNPGTTFATGLRNSSSAANRIIELPDVDGSSSVGIINTTTVVLSSATLNSTYPGALPGTQIICQSIIAGTVIYVKASGTTWLTVASTITP